MEKILTIYDALEKARKGYEVFQGCDENDGVTYLVRYPVRDVHQNGLVGWFLKTYHMRTSPQSRIHHITHERVDAETAKFALSGRYPED